MKLSEATQYAIKNGGMVAVAPNGDYDIFDGELSAKNAGYAPLLGVVRGNKIHAVMVYVEYPNKADGQESMLINAMGAMLNPSLNDPIDPIEESKRQAERDARIAERQAQEQQAYLDKIYGFARECVRMELNLRGFSEDEPLLCFDPQLGDEYILYGNEDDTEQIAPIDG
jgi:hypothetical protein